MQHDLLLSINPKELSIMLLLLLVVYCQFNFTVDFFDKGKYKILLPLFRSIFFKCFYRCFLLIECEKK